jgi:predicted AlkP superfamily pyrophosphatase or phosphodiesterase
VGLKRTARALVFALTLVAVVVVTRAEDDPILILISFDGFRWDYDSRFPAPNLHALARRGVRAKEMIPSFPVLTFPNHYTIVTGLYPEHHGVVANNIVEPGYPVKFTMSNDDAVRDGRWWGGEPLWVTAERQGRRSAAMFWPGTEAEIRGLRPSYYRAFDGKLPAASRTAQVLEWLALPQGQRPSFITLYFDDVDHAGHDHGPDSVEMRRAVATLDHELGTLAAGVRQLGLDAQTTLIVTSDHGMAPLSESRLILLDDYIDVSAVDVIESGGFLALAPREGVELMPLYQRLRDAHPRLRVYTRDAVPSRLHYSNNPRIAPIIGIPDAGWAVTTRAVRQRRHDDGRAPQAATHGFDPANTIMHAIFVAAGPELRRGLVVEPFENVDLYNFICAVLKITPAPNDGHPGRAAAWFQRSPQPQPR